MSQISLESLYYFLVLSESCHYSEAACQLYVTQQALSKRIKQLEAQLGIQLFETQGRRQSLSAAGLQLQHKARQLIGQFQKMDNFFQQADLNNPEQVLKLSVPIFPRLPGMLVIRQMLKNNPKLRFDCFQDILPEQMEQDLLNSELDCAFYAYPPSSPLLAYQAISRRKFIVIAVPENSHLNWNQIDFIKYTPLYEPYTRLFWPVEMHSQKVCAEADLENALHICSQGKGAMYLPESFARYRLMRKDLVQLSPPPFEHFLTSYLLWRPDLKPESLAGFFVEQIRARSELADE